MDELLAHPAVQSAVAPFLAALLVAAPLRRTRWLGLASVAAFAVVIGLTIGFSFESLTATRKLILAGLATAPVLLALELAGAEPGVGVRAALAAVMAAVAVWVVWRVLQQQEAVKAALYGVAAAAYVALLLESSLRVGGDAIRGSATALMLGLAGGGLALLGASAMLAQIGIAIAAGGGAVLLTQMVASQRAPAGWTLVLPAAVTAGLVGLLAVFTGSLPWFCLIPTLAIPWATRVVSTNGRALWLTSVLSALATLVPALIALGLAWFAAAG